MPSRRLSTNQSAAAGLRHVARRQVLVLLTGLTVTTAIPRAANAQPAAVERPSPGDLYAKYVSEAALRFGVPPAWIRAVMRAESDSDISAISRKGAIGLMQIMPATWAELRLRHGLGRDPFDPRDNILAGAAYLRELYDRYGSPGFLAAYNAGPSRYEAYLAGRPLPAETRAYVARLAPIIGIDKRLRPFAFAVVDPKAWKGAPLFVAQFDGQSVAMRPLIDRRPNDEALGPSSRSITAIMPRSQGLFAAHAGGRRGA
ncbi:lytic transglycosylase [Labrys sp. WJW]|uniref:lytic transglycosylase domain-containing protein n=1 Tax=Labrys sp. WJW TaxID=1737983 RepID=UPI000831FD83|nr:lytic transglycosylase domain-containing protein [Labrys sp. WJW]OCC05399.1 lytic transglycosylase [Labrys sp. WJW]